MYALQAVAPHLRFWPAVGLLFAHAAVGPIMKFCGTVSQQASGRGRYGTGVVGTVCYPVICYVYRRSGV